MGGVSGWSVVVWVAAFGGGAGGASVGNPRRAFRVISGVWASTVGTLVR